MTTTKGLPPLRKSDRPASLRAPAGWRKALEDQAGKHAADHALQTALGFHARTVAAWDRLEEVRQNRHPHHTAAAHIALVDRSAGEMMARFGRDSDGVLDLLASRRNQVKTEIRQRLGITMSPEVPEVRAILRGMGAADRGRHLRNAVEQGDRVVMSALFETQSATLLGMAPGEIQRYQELATRTHAADLLALDDALERAQTLLTSALVDAQGLRERVAGDPLVQAEFVRATEAAEAAALGLRNAIS